MLQAVKHGLDLVHLKRVFVVRRTQPLVDLLQCLGEVARIVHTIQKGMGYGPVALRHGSEVELPQQVILEGFAAAVAALKIGLPPIVLGAWCGGGRRGLVNIIPGGVHREVVGDLAVVLPVLVFPALWLRGAGIIATVVGLAGFVRVRALVAAVGGVAIVRVGFRFLGGFEHGVGLQLLLDFLLKVERGELE